MAAGSNQPECVVTLDIYSGRPNPEWTLSDIDARELLARIDTLTGRLASPPDRDDRLGYRGLHVKTRRHAKDVEITVGNGTVELQEGSASSFYPDQNRQLERWLFSTGRDRLSPQLVQVVDQELSKPD